MAKKIDSYFELESVRDGRTYYEGRLGTIAEVVAKIKKEEKLAPRTVIGWNVKRHDIAEVKVNELMTQETKSAEIDIVNGSVKMRSSEQMGVDPLNGHDVNGSVDGNASAGKDDAGDETNGTRTLDDSSAYPYQVSDAEMN